MSLRDLTQADFQFYQNYADKMRKCHDSEFMEEINPDLIRAFYRGRKVKDKRFLQAGQGMSDSDHLLVLSLIFSSANTILPNLYYRNPSPIITALRGQNGMVSPEESAALLTALEKYYMKKNDGKGENQECVLNAYHFGIGWKKIGYQLKMAGTEAISNEPESAEQGADKAGLAEILGLRPPKPVNPVPMQSKPSMEFVEDEGLFNSSESPMNVMLDHKSDLRNGKAVLHRVSRTLYELMSFGSYDPTVLQEIFTKYKYSRGSRLDTRDIDLELNELHVRQKNGIWILPWIDGFDKPLQYERSTWQGKGFQLTPLIFTNEPGVRYPISHMKIACQVQDKIDKMASLFYQTVARSRNMLFINSKDLQQGTIDAIEKNAIHGIALTNKPISAGTFQHAQSPSVQNDLPTLIAMCQSNLVQVMGADEQLVSGKSKNKTLGQDELARVGTKVRESGMQDKVKDHLINQAEKEAILLKEFGEAELKLEITGDDFADPIMAEKMEKQTIEFMSMSNPLPARKYIENVEYNFDFNMEDALKPDREKIMTDIERAIAFTSNPIIEEGLNNDGVTVRTGLLAKEWLSNIESLGNAKKYIVPITPMQLAAKQAKKVLMGAGGQMGSQPKPPAPTQKQAIAGKPEAEETNKSSQAAGI